MKIIITELLIIQWTSRLNRRQRGSSIFKSIEPVSFAMLMITLFEGEDWTGGDSGVNPLRWSEGPRVLGPHWVKLIIIFDVLIRANFLSSKNVTAIGHLWCRRNNAIIC